MPQQVLAQFETLDTPRLGRVPSIFGTTQTQWWKDTFAGIHIDIESVGIDLMAAGMSSQPFFEDVKVYATGMPLASLISSSAAFDAFVRQNNPDMLYADHDGYASSTVTPTQFVTDFNR